MSWKEELPCFYLESFKRIICSVAPASVTIKRLTDHMVLPKGPRGEASSCLRSVQQLHLTGVRPNLCVWKNKEWHFSSVRLINSRMHLLFFCFWTNLLIREEDRAQSCFPVHCFFNIYNLLTGCFRSAQNVHRKQDIALFFSWAQLGKIQWWQIGHKWTASPG